MPVYLRVAEPAYQIRLDAARVLRVKESEQRPMQHIEEAQDVIRCAWARTPLSIEYHDQEWGVPLHDDERLFELLSLEGAQAGLSWETILRKRQGYRAAFDNFQPGIVSEYGPQKVEQLLADPGIVRNRAKVLSVIQNARALLKVQQEYGSFHHFIWQFVDFQPQRNHWSTLAELPTSTPTSDTMSKTLKKHGFNFVGTTICYSFMQATGLVNDHTGDCFRYNLV